MSIKVPHKDNLEQLPASSISSRSNLWQQRLTQMEQLTTSSRKQNTLVS